MFRQVTTEKIDIAAVSNTDQKVNDKKCVPKNVMSATQTFVCRIIGMRLHRIFFDG